MNKKLILSITLACSTLLTACLNTTSTQALDSHNTKTSAVNVKTDPNGRQVNADNKLDAPYVVMISLDGFRHDYIEMYQPPFLSSIVNKGFRAKQITPVFPSLTFPNHYTLVTGMYAGNHGLVSNKFGDPIWQQKYAIGNSATTTDGKWYGGNPLWLSVREQGLLSASFFWVGSDANIQGKYPNYYVPYDGSVSYRARTKQIVDWLKLPHKQRPHFLTLYFSATDHAGHDFGPESAETKAAVLKVDKHLSQLVQEVEQLNLPVNFVIVSDHGMKAIDNDKTVYLKNYLDTSKVTFFERGAVTTISVHDKNDIAEVKHALEQVPYSQVFLNHELPEHYQYKHNPRSGDMVLLAEPGAYIYPNKEAPTEQTSKPKQSGGTHGYDPYTTPEMGGILLSFGPNVKSAGMVQAVDNIHVFPYVMELLQLQPVNGIDGKLDVLAPYIKK